MSNQLTGEEEPLLALVLPLRVEAGLEGAPRLEEGLALRPLRQVLGVQPDPVHRQVQEPHGEEAPHRLQWKR